MLYRQYVAKARFLWYKNLNICFEKQNACESMQVFQSKWEVSEYFFIERIQIHTLYL